MSRHTVTMQRIGRTHNPAPFEVEGDTPDAIAEAIYAKARPMLGSREIAIEVGSIIDPGLVRITVGGLRDGGEGRIEPGIPMEDFRA